MYKQVLAVYIEPSSKWITSKTFSDTKQSRLSEDCLKYLFKKFLFFNLQVREFLRGVAARHPNFVSTLIEVYRPRVEALKNKGLWTMNNEN
jgi:hypothetical protein